jgi:hypothetical protein
MGQAFIIGNNMAWTARNNGLVGTGLNVNYIVQNPATRHLSSLGHELIIATDQGVLISKNGGRSWFSFTIPDPSNAEFGDSPAALRGELTFHWAAYDRLVKDTIYILAAKDSVERIWIYKSTDKGVTWTSRGVTTV